MSAISEDEEKYIFNVNGANFEKMDFMRCSICLKLFKTMTRYEAHMKVTHNHIKDKNTIPCMIVYREMPANEDNSELLSDGIGNSEAMITETPTTSNSVIMENYDDIYRTTQAIVKSNLPETIGVTLKNLTNAIKPNITWTNLQHINSITTDVFRRTISSISTNIRNQLLKRILQSHYFTLHLAESLDIKNIMMLIVTIRYIYATKIYEEILFCQQLIGTFKEEIYSAVLNFMTCHQLDWNKCIGISMNDIRAESEPLKYFRDSIYYSNLATNITFTFSRFASFIEQHLPVSLAEVLSDAVAIIKILKWNPALNFVTNMDDGYDQVFYYTDKYWLSHGRLLSTLFEKRDLCKDIPDISCFKDKMNNIIWIQKLAYLVDIFECFRRFNHDLQTQSFTIFHSYDKIISMRDLLNVYTNNIVQDNFEDFPNLHHLENLESRRFKNNTDPEIKLAILENLQYLQNGINHYLPVPESEIEDCAWVRNPFAVASDIIPSNFSTNEKEMLRILRQDGFTKTEYSQEKLEYFWTFANERYPDLANKAVKYLLKFKNSLLSEKAFALLADIRFKKLTDTKNEDCYIRINLSNIEPELDTSLLGTSN